MVLKRRTPATTPVQDGRTIRSRAGKAGGGEVARGSLLRQYSRLPETATWVSRLRTPSRTTIQFPLWIDTRELKAGLDWDEEIDEALGIARACCS